MNVIGATVTINNITGVIVDCWIIAEYMNKNEQNYKIIHEHVILRDITGTRYQCDGKKTYKIKNKKHKLIGSTVTLGGVTGVVVTYSVNRNYIIEYRKQVMYVTNTVILRDNNTTVLHEFTSKPDNILYRYVIPEFVKICDIHIDGPDEMQFYYKIIKRFANIEM